MEAVFDPFAPLGRVGGDGAGELVEVEYRENINGVFDVFEPLGLIFPSLTHD